MKREIKFRAWTMPECEMTYSDEYENIADFFFAQFPNMKPTGNELLMQYTGLKDKNGKEIYEGDILKWHEIYTEYQTHTGDNIPNGSYTEPCGIISKEMTAPVVFVAPSFTTNDPDEETGICPLNMYVHYDKIDLREMAALPSNVSDEELWESGVLQICDDLKINPKTFEEFFNLINGCEVIGNIYENHELL